MNSTNHEVDLYTLTDILADHLDDTGLDAHTGSDQISDTADIFVADKYGNKFIVTVKAVE